MKHISAADAKAHFSALIAEVEHGKAHIVIERHGRPVAALVSIEDLERLGNNGNAPTESHGLLGMWARGVKWKMRRSMPSCAISMRNGRRICPARSICRTNKCTCLIPMP